MLVQVNFKSIEQEKLYCLGVEEDGTKNGFLFDPKTNQFEAFNFPQQLNIQNYCQHVYLGNGWVISTGGINHLYNRVSNSATAWNIETQKIIDLPPMHDARFCHASVYLNKRLFVFGGMTHPFDEEGIIDRGEFLDTESNRWIRIRPMKIPRCSFFSIVLLGKFIEVYCSRNPLLLEIPLISSSAVDGEVENLMSLIDLPVIRRDFFYSFIKYSLF